MTQTMDLNKMGLAPMSELEMDEVDGGGLWPVALGAWVMSNWSDIKKGFADGLQLK